MTESRRPPRIRGVLSAVLAGGALVLAGCAGQQPADDIPAGPSEAPPEGPDTSSPSAPAPTGAAPTSPAPAPTAAPAPTTEPTPEIIELPRGGTEFFPRYRLFGYAGAPGAEAFGRLGVGDLDDRVVEMQERGEEYLDGRELMPVLELIATVVHPRPMDDGMFRTRMPDSVAQDYLDAARRHDGILLLNIQPGLAPMADEVRYWEHFLVEPDVGVALDPEWDVGPGQIPGQVYGHTEGEEMEEIAAYLSDLVAEHELPEKVMVYHQVHPGVVSNLDALGEHNGVVIINSIDGIGHPNDKVATYNRIMPDKPDHVVAGFKLFYEEDSWYGPLMTAEEVLALDPQPEYILWE